jgi:hypothetical protein
MCSVLLDNLHSTLYKTQSIAFGHQHYQVEKKWDFGGIVNKS